MRVRSTPDRKRHPESVKHHYVAAPAGFATSIVQHTEEQLLVSLKVRECGDSLCFMREGEWLVAYVSAQCAAEMKVDDVLTDGEARGLIGVLVSECAPTPPQKAVPMVLLDLRVEMRNGLHFRVEFKVDAPTMDDKFVEVVRELGKGSV